MKSRFHLLGIMIMVVSTVSCSSTFYNVVPIPDKSKCDTILGRLNLRIINAGKIGISSIGINTDSGYVTLPGVEPGDTSCYFPLPPLFDNAEYKISSFRLRTFRQPYFVSFGVTYADHDTHKKLSTGFHTMTIELVRKNKKGEIKIRRTWIE